MFNCAPPSGLRVKCACLTHTDLYSYHTGVSLIRLKTWGQRIRLQAQASFLFVMFDLIFTVGNLISRHHLCLCILWLIALCNSRRLGVTWAHKAFWNFAKCRNTSCSVMWSWCFQQLPRASHALQITWKQAELNELDESTCRALRPVMKDCQAGVNDLKVILEKVAPSPSAPEWKRNLKALKSCFHDKDITLIAASISKSLTVISQYYGAYTTTTTWKILKKLTAAVATIPDQDGNESDAPVHRFMIPIIWSNDWTGRKETMERLDNMMSDCGKHRQVALVGLGGVGKTGVMLEYAYRYVLGICWITILLMVMSRF